MNEQSGNEGTRGDDRQPVRVGQAAAGSHGSWEVAIDQSVSGDEKWYLQIDGTSCELYVELLSLSRIVDVQRILLRSLQGLPADPRFTDVTIGTLGGLPVDFLIDDERGCVRILVDAPDVTALSISFCDHDLSQLAAAVDDLVGELKRQSYV